MSVMREKIQQLKKAFDKNYIMIDNVMDDYYDITENGVSVIYTIEGHEHESFFSNEQLDEGREIYNWDGSFSHIILTDQNGEIATVKFLSTNTINPFE